jgi:predicted unusual protein kinase regulating ubiquinone biosynthesis (AarF/ABC1/UbiB family)
MYARIVLNRLRPEIIMAQQKQTNRSNKTVLARMKRQRTRRLAKLIVRAYYLQQRGKEEAMYNLVCEEFVNLGGVYVKFLQGVLLNSKVMRKWHNPAKLKIFENLDTVPLDIVAILRSELTPEKLSQIKLIQPEPFAAGSFGQVYYGQRADGTPIVIKVLRPFIRELLRHDLRLLAIFSRNFVNRQYQNIDMNLGSAVREFRAATLRETDYIGEAEFATELYDTYHNHPLLVIPKTYQDLCTQHIIVQDYVDGISGADLVKLTQEGVDAADYVRQHLGSDIDKQLETLGVESLFGAFKLPRIQGDPHPGNLRFMKNDRIALIDFGISARSPSNLSAFFGVITEWHKLFQGSQNMVSLFEQFLRFFVNDLYRALRKLSSMAGRSLDLKTPDKNLTEEVGHLVQEIVNSAIGTNDLKSIVDGGRSMQTLNQIINRGNRFGLVMHLDSSEILRATSTYISVVETLGRRQTVLPKVFETVVQRVSSEHPELYEDSEEATSTSEAIETINHWLERVAVRDPALFKQIVRRIRLYGPTTATQQVPVPIKEEESHA